MKRIKHVHLVGVPIVVLLWTLVFAGYAAAEGAPEKVNCNAEIQWEVAPAAKITQFDCALGKHGGEPALIFSVGIENPTNTALRYRVNIFLEDLDKAAGHLVPRTGKPPVIEPGKAETVKIPFIKLEKESKKILVIVKTISF